MDLFCEVRGLVLGGYLRCALAVAKNRCTHFRLALHEYVLVGPKQTTTVNSSSCFSLLSNLSPAFRAQRVGRGRPLRRRYLLASHDYAHAHLMVLCFAYLSTELINTLHDSRAIRGNCSLSHLGGPRFQEGRSPLSVAAVGIGQCDILHLLPVACVALLTR